MSTSKSKNLYKKPPATEAIIDIQYTLPDSVKVDSLKDIYPHIKKEYPNFTNIRMGEGQFQISDKGFEDITWRFTYLL